MNISKYYRFLLALMVLAVAHQAYAYTSNDYYKAGLKLYSVQNYGQAVKYFAAALSLNPNNTAALQGRANCYYASGQYQQALADYQQVQALTPSDQLAQFIIKVQDKANASSALPAPQISSSYFDQGVALFQQKQYAGSVPLFQQACQQDPGNYKPYYYLGIAEVMLGDNKDGAVALGMCNLKHPDAAIAAYANRLKAGLSPDGQQWVDAQLSGSSSQPVAGNSNAAPSKIFGIRLEPAVAMVNLADFETNGSTLLSLATQLQPSDPSLSDTGTVPQGGLNIAIEPVMSLGNNLEIGLPLAFFPVGTASDIISDSSGAVSLSDSYAISAFSAGVNLRYFIMKGDFQPFVAIGGLVEPISVAYNFFESNSGNTTQATGNFSGVVVGALAQLGLDWHLGDTFVISPFLGYQISSTSTLTGNFTGTINGTTASYTGQLEMQPSGTSGYTIFADSSNFTPSSGSRPLQIDLSGIKAGIGISAYF